MKVTYRGFEIEASRNRTLGGWSAVQFYIMRVTDGYILVEDHTEASDPVHSIIKGLKGRVDEAIRTRGQSECCCGRFADVQDAEGRFAGQEWRPHEGHCDECAPHWEVRDV